MRRHASARVIATTRTVPPACAVNLTSAAGERFDVRTTPSRLLSRAILIAVVRIPTATRRSA